MAVKFPLEVKNGVKARNIAELKDNFDIGKVVGYFLDGKLKNWLDARYYEEEAEAIEQLDENDVELAKKICEIFDVPYEDISVDVEEIVKRNERISKLKQFTADEEIIANIDYVAFDQRELEELYDMGAKKIYLFEGNFVIPKAKRKLEYVLISNPKVVGLKKETYNTKEKPVLETTCSVYDIPLKIANEINVGHYAESDDYIVYNDEFHIYRFSKKDNSISEIFIFEEYKHSVSNHYFTAYGNNIIFAPYNQYSGILLNYDLEQNECSQTRIYDSWHGVLKEKYVDDEKIAYIKKECIQVYNFKTGKDEFCFSSWKVHEMNFILFNNKLFIFEPDYYENEKGDIGFIGNLYYLDFNEHMKRVEVLSYKDKECYCREAKFYISNNKLYVILYQASFESKSERFGFKVLRVRDSIVDTLIDLNGQNIGFREDLPRNYKYIPFVKLDELYSLYLLDLESNEVIKIAEGCGFKGRHYKEYRKFCNSHQIVGNYLYYEKSEKKRLYRVDLKTGYEMPIK